MKDLNVLPSRRAKMDTDEYKAFVHRLKREFAQCDCGTCDQCDAHAKREHLEAGQI